LTQDPCCNNPDPSGSNHPDCLAEEIETHQSFKREILSVDARMGEVCLAVECQDQRNGVFRHGVR
jgi:hypothetical protein